MHSRDNNYMCMMLSKSENIEIMINDKSDEVIQERFDSLLPRYKLWLKT